MELSCLIRVLNGDSLKLIVNDVLTIQQGANVINNVIQGEGGKYFVAASLSGGKYYDYGVIVIK